MQLKDALAVLRQSVDLSHVICTALILFTWADIKCLGNVLSHKALQLFGARFPRSTVDPFRAVISTRADISSAHGVGVKSRKK